MSQISSPPSLPCLLSAPFTSASLLFIEHAKFPPWALCPCCSLCLEWFSWPNPSCQIGTQLRSHLDREAIIVSWVELFSPLLSINLCSFCFWNHFLQIFILLPNIFSPLDVGRGSACLVTVVYTDCPNCWTPWSPESFISWGDLCGPEEK